MQFGTKCDHGVITGSTHPVIGKSATAFDLKARRGDVTSPDCRPPARSIQISPQLSQGRKSIGAGGCGWDRRCRWRRLPGIQLGFDLHMNLCRLCRNPANTLRKKHRSAPRAVIFLFGKSWRPARSAAARRAAAAGRKLFRKEKSARRRPGRRRSWIF